MKVETEMRVPTANGVPCRLEDERYVRIALKQSRKTGFNNHTDLAIRPGLL
jgi:hypothetical protein